MQRMHDRVEGSPSHRSPVSSHLRRAPAVRLLGTLAVLLAAGVVAGMGCGQEPPPPAVTAPPLGAQANDDACACSGGFYYNGEAIPIEDTRCDSFVCGRDLIAYHCVDLGANDNWRSFPGNRCGDLSCRDAGTFCGADVVNGEPAALYQCAGAGQIPLEWTICEGGCRRGACTDAATSECPCEVPPVAGGERIPRTCGQRVCFPTGAGSDGVKMVCTADGWQSLGLSCTQRAGTCNACRGVQDSFDNEVTTTACGETICGLGHGNRSEWICGEEGWLDLNRPCEPGKPEEEGAEFGRCPEQFQDKDGKWKSVEQGQTFCGDQVFRSPWNNDLARSFGEPLIKIKGKATQLFACPGPGARPVPYRECSALGGTGECKTVRELPGMRYHEAEGAQAEQGAKVIRDWDRCDEACPTVAEAAYTRAGPDGNRVCRHLFCGQHGVTGRVGTLYQCAYDDWTYCPPPAQSTSSVVGRPVPYQECSEACLPRDAKGHHDVCDSSVDPQEPFGIPDPAPEPSPSSRCDAILDYQGNEVPPSSRRRGASVCGRGGQVFECRDRQLYRPDGWHATGISCGTACGICGPDPYGVQSSFCRSITEFFGNTCSDITADADAILCNNSDDVLLNDPAYCGHNPGLHAAGDPWMLYTCKAYCEREDGATTRWVPCEGREGDGQNRRERTRVYRFDHATYCPLGCRVNERVNDACIAPTGNLQFPFPDHKMIQNIGHKPDWNEGRHLGEDIGKASGRTEGTYVFPIAPGKLLRAGINCSQYLGIALVEHRFKENGEEKRFCSFYGHLDVDELAMTLVGQDIGTDTPLGKIAYWDDIPRQHNLYCENKWTECPAEDSFPCNAGNSHLHYAVLSHAECARFDDGGGAPPGYDECNTASAIGYLDTETRIESYTALDGTCTIPISSPDGYISPEWFVTSRLH
ncbi:hypothetical protein [Sorangium sp. So ce117]|uniref:hypothetical protein n=1 Tax=Sorangium sp. So ce117 TaxID=3133277 RepID=UPI003F6442E5